MCVGVTFNTKVWSGPIQKISLQFWTNLRLLKSFEEKKLHHNFPNSGGQHHLVELKCLKRLHCLIQNLVSFKNKFPERINVESLSQVGGSSLEVGGGEIFTHFGN